MIIIKCAFFIKLILGKKNKHIHTQIAHGDRPCP